MSQPKTPDANQSSFLYPNLLDQLNPKHPLLQLANQIDWSFFETGFAPLYSHRGKPSKPIRLMVGLSILKHLGHLKNDHRLKRNFLKGFVGDQINLLMAAATFNFRKWMREVFLI